MGSRPIRAAGKVQYLMKTMRQIAEERRAAKLQILREQVENGTLVIRQMTKKERERYGVRRDGRKRAA
jgi:signal recognition particle GTPase